MFYSQTKILRHAYLVLCLLTLSTLSYAQVIKSEKPITETNTTQVSPENNDPHVHGPGCNHNHERVKKFQKRSIENSTSRSSNPMLTPPTNIKVNIEGPNAIHLTWDKSTGCPSCAYLVLLNDQPVATASNFLYASTHAGTDHVGFHRTLDMTANMPELGESFNVYVATYDPITQNVGSYGTGGSAAFGWKTLGQQTNDLNFSFSNWTSSQEATLTTFVNNIKPIIKNIYGPPARSIDVRITNAPQLGPFYDGISNIIYVPDFRIFGSNSREFHLLVHEILHAWRDNVVLATDEDWVYDPLLSGYEEGFAQIGAHECMNAYATQFPNLNDITGSTPNSSFITNSYKFFNFDFSNQSSLTTGSLHTSFAYNRGIVNERYEMAGSTLKKIDIEKPGFFAAFNVAYYRALNLNNTTAVTKPFLDGIITSYTPQIEGTSTASWLAKQHVLGCQNVAGKKIFVRPAASVGSAHANWMHIHYYETFHTANDPYKADGFLGADYHYNGPDYSDINSYSLSHLNGTVGSMQIKNSTGQVLKSFNPKITVDPINGYGKFDLGFVNQNIDNSPNQSLTYWGENTDLALYKIEATFGNTSTTKYQLSGSMMDQNNGIAGGIINGNGGTISLKHENYSTVTTLPISNGAFYGTTPWTNIYNPSTTGYDSVEGQVTITYTDDAGNVFETFRNIDIGNGFGVHTFLFDVNEMTPISTSVCEAPSSNDILMVNQCSGKIYWKTNAYVGTLHQYRYRPAGNSNWTTLSANTSKFRYVGFAPECTQYYVQMRVYCSATQQWSNWSATKGHKSRADMATSTSLSADAYQNFAYLYCNGYSGDLKQFRYWVPGQARKYKSTTSHYAETVLDLPSNMTYYYQVRRKCGTTGTWSCFSAAKTFTTAVGFEGDGGNERVVLEEDESSEKALKIICAPNPSNGRFTLSGDLVKVGNELVIHNLTGTKVIQKTIDDNINMEFNLKLQAGAYFLTITNKDTGRQVSERIAIQNL